MIEECATDIPRASELLQGVTAEEAVPIRGGSVHLVCFDAWSKAIEGSKCLPTPMDDKGAGRFIRV